jgi:hypothetical protein
MTGLTGTMAVEMEKIGSTIDHPLSTILIRIS